MGNTLNLFPDRAAIGRTDANGNVYMTPEFSRALAALLVRVGGAVSTDMGEIALEVATLANATGSMLARRLADLDRQLEQAGALVARLGELRKQVAALEASLVNVPAPTDWEHPGKIGAAKANAGTFTTVNRLTLTQPTTGATFTLANGKTLTVTNTLALAGGDGKTFTISNTLGLSGTDGAFLNIGNGGTLGSAAYANTTAFAARSSTALAPVATDAASTQALANSIRSVLLSVGIGA